MSYIFSLSAYIHNNPTDISGYKTCPEKFKYSTLGMYLGLNSDAYGIVDESFVMGFLVEMIKERQRKAELYVYSLLGTTVILHISKYAV